MTAVILLDVNQRAQVGRLLDMFAEQKRPCEACKRTVWFLRTKNGKLMPVDDDAVSHFASCSDPARFRKRG